MERRICSSIRYYYYFFVCFQYYNGNIWNLWHIHSLYNCKWLPFIILFFCLCELSNLFLLLFLRWFESRYKKKNWLVANKCSFHSSFIFSVPSHFCLDLYQFLVNMYFVNYFRCLRSMRWRNAVPVYKTTFKHTIQLYINGGRISNKFFFFLGTKCKFFCIKFCCFSFRNSFFLRMQWTLNSQKLNKMEIDVII